MAQNKFATIPPKSLAEAIDASSVSFKLKNINGFDGQPLQNRPVGEVIYATFQSNDGTELELVQIDASTIADPVILFTKRGIQFEEDGTELEVAANKKTWTTGFTIVNLGSNPPALFNSFAQVGTDQSIQAVWTFVNGIKIQNAPVDGDDAVNKAYVDGVIAAGAPDSSVTQKGIVKTSVAPALNTEPIVVGDNDPRVPTQDENDAMVAASGQPVSSTNKFLDEASLAANGGPVAQVQQDPGVEFQNKYRLVDFNGTDTIIVEGDATPDLVVGGDLQLNSTGLSPSNSIKYQDTLNFRPDTDSNSVTNTYYDFVAPANGGIRIFFESDGSTGYTRFRTVVNGVIQSDAAVNLPDNNQYNQKQFDVTFNKGDLVELQWGRDGFGSDIQNVAFAYDWQINTYTIQSVSFAAGQTTIVTTNNMTGVDNDFVDPVEVNLTAANNEVTINSAELVMATYTIPAGYNGKVIVRSTVRGFSSNGVYRVRINGVVAETEALTGSTSNPSPQTPSHIIDVTAGQVITVTGEADTSYTGSSERFDFYNMVLKNATDNVEPDVSKSGAVTIANLPAISYLVRDTNNVNSATMTVPVGTQRILIDAGYAANGSSQGADTRRFELLQGLPTQSITIDSARSTVYTWNVGAGTVTRSGSAPVTQTANFF